MNVSYVSVSILLQQNLTVRKSHNPGNCSEAHHGEIILVKDRENKDTILVCTEDNGNYAWKTTDSKLMMSKQLLCINHDAGFNTTLMQIEILLKRALLSSIKSCKRCSMQL